MAKRAFGELESQILYILKSGKRKTVKEVHQALGGADNYNTVMTVMSRLAEKNQLTREKTGLQYVYWILDTSSSSLLDKLKTKLLSVKATTLVAHLIETDENLSDDDLAEMEKIIQQARTLKK